MKTGRGFTSEGCAFRTLIYILLLALLLAASVAAISKRSEVFVGYAEKNEQHSKCSDSMDAEMCASYKSSRMCKTGLCCFKSNSSVCNLHLWSMTTLPYYGTLGMCRVRKDGMQEDMWVLLTA